MRTVLLVSKDCSVCPDAKEQLKDYIAMGDVEVMDRDSSEGRKILAKSPMEDMVPQLVFLGKDGSIFNVFGF